MNRYTFKNLQRVTKRTAKKLYLQGLEILLVPCKVCPDNMWGIGQRFQKDMTLFESDFDKLVSYFEYYNCQYNELGKYAAYYVKEV